MDIKVKSKIKILSTGTFLPQQIVRSDDLFREFKSYENYNIAENWLSDKVGIIERRMGAADALPSQHAIPAAQMALDDCPDINKDDINLVIFCGIERDQPEPATAHTLQKALGLKAKHAFDLANACFGFVEALEVATHYINGGATDYALIITGEIPTQITRKIVEDLKQGLDLSFAKTQLGALTVGDAGGAVILGGSDREDDTGFNLFNSYVDSDHVDKCIYRHTEDGRIDGQMLMGPISNLIVREHKALMPNTLKKLGWTAPDWVISHQMGKPPFEKILKVSGVEEGRMIKTYDLLGNITSATFAVNYHRLKENSRVRSGDRVFGYFAGSGLAIGQLGYTF